MFTKTRKNKNDDDNESDNNNSDKICAEDDVAALKPSFCLHNHVHNNGELLLLTKMASNDDDKTKTRDIF